MEKLGFLMVLASFCSMVLTRPHSEEIKRKYPPPDAGFISRDSPTNLTIDELLTQQLGGAEDIASRVVDGGGSILTELDLLLTPEQFAALHPQESDILLNYTREGRQKRKAARDPKYRWTGAEIPYYFDATSFDAKEQFMIVEAMSEWERYTCLKFKPAETFHTNVLQFLNGKSCSSQLGMVGGAQGLYLQKPGCRYRGLYLHEIGHAIGLIHEHQRPDRDNYIDIVMGNVDPALRSQFVKYTLARTDLVDTTYEYSSIMHYGVTAFSYNDKAVTIRAKDPAREEEIGYVYLKELSFMDVKAVHNMYNCSDHCPNTVRCSDGGFVDQNCRCVCPDGSRDCEVGHQKGQISGDCSNKYDDWQCSIWANHGQCQRNQKFMSENCKKACQLCGSAAPSGECSDVFSATKCEMWKGRGDCVANEWWMSQNCRQTCNACVSKDQRAETKCANKHNDTAECEKWAISGECQVNRNWMLNNCQSACQYCHKTPPVVTETSGNCQDGYFNKESCAKWAKSGECQANPDWMAVNCRKSCGKCTGGGVTEQPGNCQDVYFSKEACAKWAESGECQANPDWMAVNCRRSCGKCGGGGVTEKPNGNKTVPCTNLHSSEQDCQVWADSGHCDINPSFMHKNCRKACRLCEDVTGGTGGCEDTYKDKASCQRWASTGECQANPVWMLDNCKKSCGGCKSGVCEDTYRHKDRCVEWADKGECQANPVWMLNNCKKSCGGCDQPVRPGLCEDKYDDKAKCADWAARGECQANPGWMIDNCMKSCRECNADIPGTSGGDRIGVFNRLVLAVVHIVVTILAKWM